MGDILAEVGTFVGIGFAVGIMLSPQIARLVLGLRRSRLEAELSRSGRLVVVARPPSKEDERAPLGHLGAALRADLRGWTTWVFVGFGIYLVTSGVMFDDAFQLVCGFVLLGLYGYMLHSVVQRRRALAPAGHFEARLVELGRAKFFTVGRASVALADGRTFEASVDWPVVELLRGRGDVILTFKGSPENPSDATLLHATAGPSS